MYGPCCFEAVCSRSTDFAIKPNSWPMVIISSIEKKPPTVCDAPGCTKFASTTCTSKRKFGGSADLQLNKPELAQPKQP